MTIVGGGDRDAEKAGERGSERGERSGRQSWIPVDARAMQRDMQWEMAREKHSALWLLHRQGNSTAAAVAAADGSTRLDNKLRVPPPLTLPPPTPPSPSPSIELPYAHSTCCLLLLLPFPFVSFLPLVQVPIQVTIYYYCPI